MRRLLTGLLLSLATALLLGPGAFAAPKAPHSVTAQRSIQLPIVVELNRVRALHGLPPLRTAHPLRLAAQSHALSMAQEGYFAHTSPNGTTFGARVARYYPAAGFRRWAVSENLLWSSSPTLTASRAVQLWMESPGHRRNILSPKWRQIGISAVHASAAQGRYGGRDVTIVVTNFGARS